MFFLPPSHTFSFLPLKPQFHNFLFLLFPPNTSSPVVPGGPFLGSFPLSSTSSSTSCPPFPTSSNKL
ncbi:hypothetical protein DSO57_1013454 [Entomophthora muscae]|uniref:Uncharacterized protein n=1 Tax=Entomophthora muscae TaxID=34485 RepID=A0ACC2SIH4_9FUNG|nr:hypothetical protein DSO57_1013454 [Entomophthora muscae]